MKVLAVTALLAALLLSASAEAVGEWRLSWENPRKDTGLPNTAVPLYGMYPSHRTGRGYANENGGYDFNVYFKKSSHTLWLGKYEEYDVKHAVFARRAVEWWNASLQFAAENYEWGRHLSKLRLKFYTDENVSLAPYIDVVIDASSNPCSTGIACAYLSDPMKIAGDLGALVHELGHTLGLGHNYDVGPVENGYDWRGWPVGGPYPANYAPPDTFVLYALAVRWSSLKNATPGSPLTFPKSVVVHYRDVADKLGPLYSLPGLVWVYHYTVLSEPGGVEIPYFFGGMVHMGNQSSALLKPVPSRSIHVWSSVTTTYKGTICIHPLDWEYTSVRNRQYWIHPVMERSNLPLLRVYGNGTALVLHDMDIGLALVDRYFWRHLYGGSRNAWVPKKYFTTDVLRELSGDTLLKEVSVIDSVGPAWDKVSRVSYRDGRVCLEGLKDRVLVELRIGRAYKVGAGMAEAVPVEGWAYRDQNGTNWVLSGSRVYFRPLSDAYSPEDGVRYVWRGLNITLTVDGPVSEGELVGKLWKKQYLVEVDSPHPFEGVGWFDEGSKTSPRTPSGYVDLGNGTRLVFKGFEGHNATEVVVDRPLKLKPVWERSYRVDMASRYVSSGAGQYVREGETIFTVMPRAQDFGNGTRVELANITAYAPSGKVVKAWDGRSGGEQLALLKLVADKPLTIRVDWNVYHRLTVRSEVNSYEAWVLNGTTHRLDLPERKLVGEDTLYVLRKVLVDGRPQEGFELTVTRPTSVEAVYQRRLMTTFMVYAGGGYLVEPSEAVLSRDGEVEVYRPPFTYMGEGTWRVAKVTYLGGEVTADATVEINMAGMMTLPSKLRAVEVSVVDLIGMPVPYASITAENTGGVTDTSGKAVIPAIPPWDFTVTASHILGRGQATITPGETTARVTAGVSPYTMTLLAALAAAGVVAWRGRLSRR